MNENNPPQKKPWEWLKPHSDPHLVEDRGRKGASQDPSSLSPSTSGSSGRSSGSVHKLFGKDLTAPTSEAYHKQSSDSGIVAKAEHLDPKFVNKRIANATKGVAGIGQVPTIVKHASSTVNNLPSVSDTIDMFSPLLRPLKAFNSIANEIANVHPYAKVALSIFTCASKVNEFLVTDDSRSGRPRCRGFQSTLKDI
ncbi:uncharacterized protein F5147DRAFT_653550 [Suillus discolor]|uniref:Uncharacterized protein n=1 Tax=Suillus discolor TaxID=1912936 RepID=A0A9P7F649_9AGAM|nr:uncharacterized protein F5147DRAFT_653550 [Suillus discolor]KAG2106953.1 hypothetical protein F5147DRAFT_653550 [Suillus discolor]